MPAYDTSSGFGPLPDPIAEGSEQIVMRQRPMSLQIASEHALLDEQWERRTPKPEIPKKNKHLEEICRLKQKLNELQSGHDHVQDSMGRIALDLDEAEQKLAAKTKELEQAESEKTTMRNDMQTLSEQLDQEKQNRIQMEDELRKQEAFKETHSSETQQKLDSLLAAMELQGVKENGEFSRLQTEVAQLNIIIASKDDELKTREAMAAEAEKTFASQLQDQTAKLNEQTKLRGTAEATLAALAAQQQKASTGLEMAELRRLCNFYQENSQRLSKQIKVALPFRPSSDQGNGKRQQL